VPSHPCSADDGEMAAFLVTDLVEDTTMGLCLPHMVGYASSLVQAYMEANAAPEPDSRGELEAAPDAPESAPVADEPPASRKRRQRPTGTHE
jgi:hypothetical protein